MATGTARRVKYEMTRGRNIITGMLFPSVHPRMGGGGRVTAAEINPQVEESPLSLALGCSVGSDQEKNRDLFIFPSFPCLIEDLCRRNSRI